MIFGKDEPITAEELLKDTKDDGFTMTLSQLSEMNGLNNNPCYISLKGLIYDVSANPDFYGSKGSYRYLIAKDATLALKTGCLSDKCIAQALKDGIPESLDVEVDRWLELYHNHDKYKYVGRLVSDPVEDAIAQDTREEALLNVGDTTATSLDRFHTLVAKGKDAFAVGDYKDTLFLWRNAADCLSNEATAMSPELALRKAELLTRMIAVALNTHQSQKGMEYIDEILITLRQSMTLCEETSHPLLGPVYARLARSLSLEASLLGDMGHDQEAVTVLPGALEYFRKAMRSAGIIDIETNSKIWKATRGEVAELWSAFMSTYLSLGFVLMRLSRFQEVIPLCEDILQILSQAAPSIASYEAAEDIPNPDFSPKAVLDNALGILVNLRTQTTSLATQAEKYLLKQNKIQPNTQEMKEEGKKEEKESTKSEQGELREIKEEMVQEIVEAALPA
eukprot:CAMPEP_0182419598 /NCGR_PEP_ID=MMETSP1167-20130531/4015_1 /TAXON_ID=2988 /ORGANISM="Mallomonas Sp, Strain CCMP3275" /LENGTH=449 /DNA_ID=CAMNT_0024594599 /DNA_START=218 /DNA_END=1567 /DNA_ORIENTATION=-